MSQTHYSQHRQNEQQLQAMLAQSTESSRGSLMLQPPQNTFDRQQQPTSQDAWAKQNAFATQSTNVRAMQQQLQFFALASASDPQQKSNDQQQQYGHKMSLDLQNVSSAMNSSSRHSSAKHSNMQRSHEAGGGFFQSQTAGYGELEADESSTQFLNKTLVISDNSKSSYSNERGNRINLHRSGRQRSHQTHHQPQSEADQNLYYDLKKQSGYDQKGDQEVSRGVKKLSSDLAVGYYHSPSESVKNATSQHYRYAQMADESELDNSLAQLPQDQFYQTQKIDGTGMFLNKDLKSSQTHQKDKESFSQGGDKGPKISESSQLHAQVRRTYDQNNVTNHNHKKKVQPQQPRSREESRRKGATGINGHNKSSETTNSYEQSSQNSSQCQQPPQPGSHKIDSDKFSQLVCQVPQGNSIPQMPQNVQQASNLIQVQDSNYNYGNQYLLGPQRASEAGRKTLVLDLDETLVHSSFKPVENADIMLPVEIDGQICTIYVLVRPFVAQFLKRMHKIYELVIFTASLSKYAEPLMQNLDPQKMCSYLLFREHCTFFNSAYVKDLTRLGRPMKDVIIVDNSPVAYLFQPENAMPAVSWYDDPNDTELNRIAILLERLNQEDDVRKVIRTVIQNNKIDPRQEQLYLASASHHRRDKSQRVDRRTKQTKLTSTNLQASEQAPQPVNIHKVHNSNTYQNENDVSQVSLRNNKQAHPNHHQNQNAVTHSRYDSSDTRQRNAALISEELNQRKRGGEDNVNMDIVLSNVQKLTQQTKDLHYEAELKKSMNQNQKEIQQAYQHHKNQIMQLQNEIAALKSQHSDQTPKNNTHRHQEGTEVSLAQEKAGHSKTTGQVQRVAHKPIGETPNDKVKPHVENQPSPSQSINKGQKQRESSRHQQQQHHYEAQQQAADLNQKVQSKGQQRNSYKMLNTNEIQLVNYLKNGTGQSNQRHSINAGEKKQLVVRESQGNNSQLHNTKQIIKLIKKSEGHSSNFDVSISARKQIQQLEATSQNQAQASQPNIGHSTAPGSNAKQQHPATTKSSSKQHFAFAQNSATSPSNQNLHGQAEPSQRQRQSQQSQGQLFNGQINMMTQAKGDHRGQQASRASSKTTKNYSIVSQNPTAGPGNVRTSYSSQKNGHSSKPTVQSSLQTHERISGISVVVGPSGSTKRSSSVKNQASGQHHGHRKGSSVGADNGRKSSSYAVQQNGSSTVQAYSNLVYDQGSGHPRRERGNSAQPLYTGQSHTNPLLINNLVTRSSSTTNKNKKVNSISGTGNFHNLVLSGSHSTKHSTQQTNPSGQTTASILQAHANQRGGSQDRQQRTGSKQSSRVKQINTKNSSQHNGSDSKDDHQQHHRNSSKQQSQQQQYSLKQQQEHLQRMQQMTSSGQHASTTKQQLSATQRISPGTMLNLAGQYPMPGQASQQQLNSNLTPSHHQQQAQAVVKHNMKDIQVQDMIRLTQNNVQMPHGYLTSGMSSTRNSKQVAQISGHMPMQAPEADDFLKKVKLQQQATLKTKEGIDMQQPRRESKQPAIQMLHQDVVISKSSQGHQNMGGLSINSPKYFSGSVQGQPGSGGASREQQKILNDIMNMAVQRELKSGSAATSYGVKQVAMTSSSGQASSGGHQIKKIRISSTQQSQNGRMSGQSNQSAPNHHHKSTGLKRGDSNHSRGSHSSAVQQTMRPSSSGVASKPSGGKDQQVRQAQLFNQTMKLKDTGARAGTGTGILSLLGDLQESHDKDSKNQTAADLFLKSHNEEQFSQTQYFGSGSQGNQMGNSQLREVTRHFYNQLAHAGSKKQ